ncbi:MAG: ABC transporter substrate-binding protein [Desulfotignum sp.]
MPYTCRTNLCCLIIIAVLCTTALAPVVYASDTKIAVVVSRKIRPYLQVTDGILDRVSQRASRSESSSPEISRPESSNSESSNSEMSSPEAADPKGSDPRGSDPKTSPETADSQISDPQISDTDVFFLTPGDDLVTTQVIDRLIAGAYDLVAAVGPEAASLVWETGIPGKKIYAAVLDPDAVPHIPDDACGISLRIPVAVQLATIADAFPSFQKIGLLFDPDHNQWFFEAAVAAAGAAAEAGAAGAVAAGGGGGEAGEAAETAAATAAGEAAASFGDRSIHIIPLQVRARNHIARVVTDNLADIDAVWMIPDQTVISEKLIQYVIKQALYKNTGVIGYNAYFTRTGALFSFEFDYLSLGRQAGELIIDYLAGKECHSVSPLFKTRINSQVAGKLGLEMEADR